MEEKQITLQIDGHFITVPEGSTILEAAIENRHQHTYFVSHRPERHLHKKQSGFLSHLRSRGNGTPQSGSCLRYPLHGRNDSENQYATRDERTQSGGRTYPVGSSQRLSHLPQMWQLRTSDISATLSISAKCLSMEASCLPASGKSLPPSCATWINVFSVAAVKVSATMFRQSVRWVPSVADSIRPSPLPLTE